MNIRLKLAFSLSALVLFAGCATTRSVVEVAPLKTEKPQAAVAVNGKEVYIQTVHDKRQFQAAPSSPSIPSLDPKENQTDSIKLRAVARKRNGFGMALGDVLLKEGESVETLTTSAVRRAFEEKGYKIVEKAEQVTPSTYVVEADVAQFWSWLTPGFFALTISTEISTDLTIKNKDSIDKPVVKVSASDHFQTGMDGNFIEVMTKALDLYVDELKKKLQ